MRWVKANASHRSPSISHPALASMASAVDVMILAGHDENFYFNRLRRSSARLRPVTVIPLSSPAKRLHAYIADTRTRASDGSAVQSTPAAAAAPLAIEGDTIFRAAAPLVALAVRALMVFCQKVAALTGSKSGSQPDDVAG